MPNIHSYDSPHCETCDTTRRLCAMCGIGPLREGWYTEDEYYCVDCNPVDISCHDENMVNHDGLTLFQCYVLLGGDDNDYVYFTDWEPEETCQCGPFEPQVIHRGC